jgi:hypothetical protein
MKKKTVILWGRGDLLGQGVESFLSSREDWNIIQVSNKESVDVLIREVKKVKPDVVILNAGDSPIDSQLPFILIQNRPALKVIMMSLENNSLEVYNKQKFCIKGAGDLLSVIDE